LLQLQSLSIKIALLRNCKATTMLQTEWIVNISMPEERPANTFHMTRGSVFRLCCLWLVI